MQQSRKYFRVAKVRGLKLSPEKAKILPPKLKFYRHILTKEGVQPDTQNTAALLHMSAPRDKQELKSLVGCVAYLVKFIPNLSKHTHDMRKLLRKDVHYKWTASHQQQFEKLKSMIEQCPTLKYFDPSQEIYMDERCFRKKNLVVY